MKHLAFVGIVFFMTGCAQYSWIHATKNEMQFNSDSAYCQNESSTRVQNQAAQPVAPIYGQSSQYNTNCSAFGNSLNCTTTSTPNYLAQMQQQNAQNMAQAGANIRTAFARQQYFDNCMISLGWSKQRVVENNSNVEELNNKYKNGIKEIRESYLNGVCLNKDLEVLFNKSPCSLSETSLAQLASSENITASEKIALLKFADSIKNLQKKEIYLIENFILQPLRSRYLDMILIQQKRYQDLMLELYEGKLTWGDYNKKREANDAINRDERNKLLQAN